MKNGPFLIIYFYYNGTGKCRLDVESALHIFSAEHGELYPGVLCPNYLAWYFWVKADSKSDHCPLGLYCRIWTQCCPDLLGLDYSCSYNLI